MVKHKNTNNTSQKVVYSVNISVADINIRTKSKPMIFRRDVSTIKSYSTHGSMTERIVPTLHAPSRKGQFEKSTANPNE